MEQKTVLLLANVKNGEAIEQKNPAYFQREVDDLKMLLDKKLLLQDYATSFNFYATAVDHKRKNPNTLLGFQLRSEYTRRFGYPLVTRSRVQQIAQDLVYPVLSVFSGLAFLESCIDTERKLVGAETGCIQCTDQYGSSAQNPGFQGECFTGAIAGRPPSRARIR